MWVFNPNKNVTLDMYIMFIHNMIPLFVTLSCDKKFTTVKHVHYQKDINTTKEISNANSL